MAGKRGLGSSKMSPEKRREIASKGGKASQSKGTGYRWTPEKASEAGKIGGKISKRKKETK